MDKEKFLILGDVDIQALINMQEALTGILRDAKDKQEKFIALIKWQPCKPLRLVMKHPERFVKKF